jgi:hypothetical protein
MPLDPVNVATVLVVDRTLGALTDYERSTGWRPGELLLKYDPEDGGRLSVWLEHCPSPAEDLGRRLQAAVGLPVAIYGGPADNDEWWNRPERLVWHGTGRER